MKKVYDQYADMFLVEIRREKDALSNILGSSFDILTI